MRKRTQSITCKMSNATNQVSNVPVRNRITNKKKNNAVRLGRIALRDYFNSNELNQNEIKYAGNIDASKKSENVRILAMNVKGCDPKNNRKIEITQDAIKKYQIDIVLFNEANAKWNSIAIDKMT